MGTLRVGSTLPPIIVGKRDDRFVIIDGRHRYEAHKRLKHKKIGVLITQLPKSKWFAEAVRLNTIHGHGLSYQEKLAAAMILKRDRFKPEEIAKIVSIPLDALEEAIAQRGTWVNPEDVRPVVVKAPLAKEAKRRGQAWLKEAAASGAVEKSQAGLSGASFERLAEELLILLADNHLDAEDVNILRLISAVNTATSNWLGAHVKQDVA